MLAHYCKLGLNSTLSHVLEAMYLVFGLIANNGFRCEHCFSVNITVDIPISALELRDSFLDGDQKL